MSQVVSRPVVACCTPNGVQCATPHDGACNAKCKADATPDVFSLAQNILASVAHATGRATDLCKTTLHEVSSEEGSCNAVSVATEPSVCVDCQVPTPSPNDLFCAPCWRTRLRRSPRFCRHETVLYDPVAHEPRCETCSHHLMKKAGTWVLAMRSEPR